jgi:hypothetical protein
VKLCAAASSAVVAALTLTVSAPAAEPELPTLPLAFAVANVDGAPVASDAWLDDQVLAAENLFAPQGVHFAKVATRALEAKHARMVTRADRDALAALLQPSVVNVFVVESLKDVDEADRFRSGVHWRATTNVAKRYVVLAASARPTVLAHELGHYFGNPHSPMPDNVMSYTRTGAPVYFDAAQGIRIRASARESLRTKELTPVAKGRP